jgi:hypothetical protein
MANVPSVAGASINFNGGGMSKLELVRRLRQECGAQGDQPNTLTNVTGDNARFAAWISSAWMDIQSMHPDWLFLRQKVQFNTEAGLQSYDMNHTKMASFGSYKLDAFRIYRTSMGLADEMILPFLPFENFRDLFLFGQMRTTQQRPTFFTLSPQKDFLLGHAPDDVYTVCGEGYAMPTELAADSDRPAMPGQFHMAIVYRAMMFYGQYENAPEVYTHGQNEFNKLIARLHAAQMPTMTFGAPLV